jgi:hypothetical protein
MDILYITPEIKQEMLKYCEQELIDFVFDNFVEQGGNIIIKKDGPSRWWIITIQPSRKHTHFSRGSMSTYFKKGGYLNLKRLDIFFHFYVY